MDKVIHTETGAERPIFIGDEVFTPFVPILDFETDTTGIVIVNAGELNGVSFEQKYPFDLSDTIWFCKYTADGLPTNIAEFLFAFSHKEKWLPDYNRYYGYKYYRLEDGQLKLYFHDDGFFIFNADGKIVAMFSQFGECTDTNWYNCMVFEEVK